MKESVVVDSTCLIALERIDALTILPSLFDPLLIPPEVEREFGVACPWIKVEAPANDALVDSLKMLVDEGEAAAIALAKERDLAIVLDDRQARSVAQQLGLRLLGTVGCVLKAKRAGVITAVKPLIEDLEKHGFYLSPPLKSAALRLAGEE